MEQLAEQSFGGCVVIEINTRRVGTRAARQADLAEALAFTRLHLAAHDPSFVATATGEIERLEGLERGHGT
jgi:hypothetical protein